MDFRLPNVLQTFPSAAVQTIPATWRRTNPRLRWILLALASLGVVALVWHLIAVRMAPPPKAPPAAPVRVATAQQKEVIIAEHTIGTVLAASTVSVTALVSGQLLSADFIEGQIVHKGDVIFRIDPKPFAAALEQAEAAYARDKATMISAELDKKRYITLAAQGAGSTQQRDQAIATADADAATVNSDKAAIDVAQLNLGYTVIRAPVDGKTGPILVFPGNLVAANVSTSPLVTITQIQPVMVSFFLPQSDLPQLQDRARAGKLVATIALHDPAASTISAPVNFISNQVQATTGTIELRATYNNDDFRLVPGQLVDVAAAINDIQNAVVVPRGAVNLGPDTHYVYVVDRRGIAHLQNVNLLYDDGVNDAIQGKVKPGDTVITVGQLRVVSGQPVVVPKPAAPSATTQAGASPK